MKDKSNRYLKPINILSVVAVLVSVISLVVSIVTILNISRELMIVIIVVVISFFSGVFSNRLTRIISKLSRARRVFLSYSHGMEDDIRQIIDVLRERGAKVWMDQERIKPGQDFKEEIKQAMFDADTVILFVGKELSPNVMYEIRLAKERGKKIIPVILESGELPNDIEGLKYIDLRKNKEVGIREIVDAST